MENCFFSEDCEKVLDLVEQISPNLTRKIKGFVDTLPIKVKECIQNEENGFFSSVESDVNVNNYGGQIEVQHIRHKKYLETSLYIFPFYEGELTDDGLDLEIDENLKDEPYTIMICSLNLKNSAAEALGLNFFYEQIEDEYKFVNLEIPNKDIELDYSVYIEYRDDEHYLILRTMLNDIEIKVKEIKMSIEELKDYAIDENNIGYDDDIL